MSHRYCEPSDLYAFGMTPGTVANPARLIYSVSPGSDLFELDAHGLYDGDQVTFRADSVDGSLPAPVIGGATYYVIRHNEDRFAVASTAGGPPVDLVSAGTRVLVSQPLPIDEAIRWASAIIDDNLPAHLVPLPEPLPEIVRATCAELAVSKITSRQGAAPDTLMRVIDAAQERLKRWSRGVPVRGAPLDTRSNRAASASAPYRDSRGWRGCRL